MSKKQLIDWGSVKIDIPAEIRFIDDKGKVKLIPSLTNSGNLKAKNKMKSIKLSTHNKNEVILKPAQLKNNRYEWNENEIIIPDEMGVDKFTKNGVVKRPKKTTTKAGNLASNKKEKPIKLSIGDNKAFDIIESGNLNEAIIGKVRKQKSVKKQLMEMKKQVKEEMKKKK